MLPLWYEYKVIRARRRKLYSTQSSHVNFSSFSVKVDTDLLRSEAKVATGELFLFVPDRLVGVPEPSWGARAA